MGSRNQPASTSSDSSPAVLGKLALMHCNRNVRIDPDRVPYCARTRGDAAILFVNHVAATIGVRRHIQPKGSNGYG